MVARDPPAVPPYHDKAEQSLLGALMKDGTATAWSAITGIVVSEDIYRSDHRLIFSAVAALVERNESPDAVLVSEYLQRLGQLEAAGGVAYLARLVEDTSSAASVAGYARVVRSYAQRRELIKLGEQLILDARKDDDLEIVVETHRRALTEIFPAARASGVASDPLEWLVGCELTSDEAAQISEPAWVEPGLIAEGHVIAVVAKPNGGKTSILFHIACTIASRYRTVYVDADTNPADAKRKLVLARQHSVQYLTPDLKVGKSMRDVVAELERLAAGDVDLTGHVWFFDTLKRMANVINKDSLKGVLGLMRKLSSRGMTCVLLGHTNKYRNADGEYVFEGTGDLESDVDELIYFEPRENSDRSLTVSTRCTKRRANIAEMTWDIHSDRTVTRRDHYVDVAADKRRREQEEADATAIDAINECLSTGPKKQIELVQACAAFRLNDKRVRTVLRRYRGRHWLESRLPTNNGLEYRRIPRMSAPLSEVAEPRSPDLL